MKRSPKKNHSIPNDNVLDLRRVVHEEPKRTGGSRFSRFQRKPGASELSYPGAKLDWTRFGREVGKFGIVIGLGMVLALAGWSVVWASGVANNVQAKAQTGVEQLQSGSTELGSLNVAEAREHFQSAQQAFTAAETSITSDLGLPTGLVRAIPFVGTKYNSAVALVNAGRSFAEAGEQISLLIAEAPPNDPLPTVTTEGVVSGSLGFLTPLLAQSDQLSSILSNLEAARTSLHQVQPSVLPADYRSLFEAWQLADASLLGSEDRLSQLVELLIGLFGQDVPQEYLVIFQNNDELRATGGFPGTVLLVKFDQGTFKILDSPVRGPYDLAAQIPKTTLPPDPIRAIAPYWTFQDANWFLDVPTSADFMLDFYEQARGFRPHGVMFLTPQLVEDLLALTGPIRPDGYGIDIDQDNFVRATELQVEFGYDLALNNPKEFLLDLIPVMFKELANLSAPAALQAFATFLTQATESNILFYSRDQALQAVIEELSWGGQLLEYSDDYLAVVDSNLGGGKTDRVIDQSVELSVTADRSLLRHQVKITRTHNGKKGDQLTGHQNRDFIRVYVPREAQFVGIDDSSMPPTDFLMPAAPDTVPSSKATLAEGNVLVDPVRQHRITEEGDRKVFGAWSLLDPGESQTITFNYTTSRGAGTWDLIWQKQPGAPTRETTVTFTLESGRVRSTTPEAVNSSSKEVSWKIDSSLSRQFSLEFSQ